MGQKDLVSRAARNEVRRLVTDLARAAIREYWENEDFAPVEVNSNDPSTRRQTFTSYAAAVDWSDSAHVERALRVFESILRRLRYDGVFEAAFEEVRELLARDGYDLNTDLRIRSRHLNHLHPRLSQLSDASGILAELDRVRRFAAEHPADAIGAAKQLIEATAQVVLTERGETLTGREDVPELVKRAQEALLLHPRQAQPLNDPDATEAVRKVLGGASSIALGVTDLRNKVGSGHGRYTAPSGLSRRHARLAINAAATWCELLLDTLADPSAPWRYSAQTTQTGP